MRMLKPIAKKLLNEVIEEWKRYTYEELSGFISSAPTTLEVPDSDGKLYLIKIQVFWDDQDEGDIRVIGAIDDGGWRSLYPITEDFIARRE